MQSQAAKLKFVQTVMYNNNNKKSKKVTNIVEIKLINHKLIGRSLAECG